MATGRTTAACVLTVLALVALLPLVAAGCAGDEDPAPRAASPPAKCPPEWRAGWQRLANRIEAPVYCPSWLPDPLTGEIDGPWNNIRSVDRDGSYLMGFTWYERDSGEVHVNLRGYPGTTRLPRCTDTRTEGGVTRRRELPCFSDPRPPRRIGGLEVTVYTANRGADQWHVLYAWRHKGSLYTVSEHVAMPLTYRQVVRNLDRMVRRLELVRPTRA